MRSGLGVSDGSVGQEQQLLHLADDGRHWT
jgi:hypothetical protein